MADYSELSTEELRDKHQWFESLGWRSNAEEVEAELDSRAGTDLDRAELSSKATLTSQNSVVALTNGQDPVEMTNEEIAQSLYDSLEVASQHFNNGDWDKATEIEHEVDEAVKHIPAEATDLLHQKINNSWQEE